QYPKPGRASGLCQGFFSDYEWAEPAVRHVLLFTHRHIHTHHYFCPDLCVCVCVCVSELQRSINRKAKNNRLYVYVCVWVCMCVCVCVRALVWQAKSCCPNHMVRSNCGCVTQVQGHSCAVLLEGLMLR